MLKVADFSKERRERRMGLSQIRAFVETFIAKDVGYGLTGLAYFQTVRGPSSSREHTRLGDTPVIKRMDIGPKLIGWPATIVALLFIVFGVVWVAG